MNLSTIKIEVKTIIHATIEEVWTALTEETSTWWSNTFYTNPKTKAFKIEAHIGGKMYEDMGNGEGLVWANVVGVDKPRFIQFQGLLSPDFGGPAISFTKMELLESDGSTLFIMTDTLMGAVNEHSKKSLQEGWEMIFKEHFKNYVEQKRKPQV